MNIAEYFIETMLLRLEFKLLKFTFVGLLFHWGNVEQYRFHTLKGYLTASFSLFIIQIVTNGNNSITLIHSYDNSGILFLYPG